MKILFIENRYKTYFWDKVAQHLSLQGHEIFWLVQNHFFLPKAGTIIKLSYFRGKYAKTKDYDPGIKKIIAGNRGLNYFDQQADDYIFYYRDEIEKNLTSISPALVIGETTLFHELLTTQACEKMQIPFLHPTSCRYPTGRFSFYQRDTLMPFGGCQKSLGLKEAKEIVDSIITRTKKPDYMIKPVPITFLQRMRDKLRITAAWIAGERFNTPSPWKKFFLEQKRKKLIAKWDEEGLTGIPDSPDSINFLYAMQMQPEANIDVWGYPFNDQTRLIMDIANQLEENSFLYIKPNPKSKYEITEALIQLAKTSSRVFLLKHEVSMESILPLSEGIITVTGTVAIEAALSNKPVLMFGEALVSDLPNVMRIQKLADLKAGIMQIRNRRFLKVGEKEKAEYINQIYSTSYRGIIGDGLHNRQYLTEQSNLKDIFAAFEDITKKVEQADQ